MSEDLKNQAIESLKNIGLSTGEAKTLIALIENGPSEASPLASVAEVPQPKIYGYLKQLISRGLITKTEIDGKATKYTAYSYKQILQTIDEVTSKKIKNTHKYFENLNKQKNQSINDQSNYLRIIQGKISVSNGIQDIINNARQNLFVISNSHYRKKVKNLIDKRKDIEYEIFDFGLNNLPPNIKDVVENALQSTSADIISDRRPFIIVNDLNMDERTAESVSTIIHPYDDYDEFIVQFIHPTVVKFQVNLMLLVKDILTSLNKYQISEK